MKTVIVILAICAIALYIPAGIAVSKGLDTEAIAIDARQIGTETNAIKIAVISDMHCPRFGIAPERVTETVKAFAPDLIFLTGDIVDVSATEEDFAAINLFLEETADLARSYAVFGNHEAAQKDIRQYKKILEKHGVTLLQNKALATEVNGQKIVVAGLEDNGDFDEIDFGGIDEAAPVFLLAHRPEKWEQYLASTPGRHPMITFAGHAHGGQIRIFGRGLYAHGSGYFPKYTDGLYKNKGVYMVVSRGLGDSDFPIRAFNRYHMPLVTVNCLK